MSKRLVLLLVVLLSVAGCGYRGALYLPEQQTTQSPPSTTNDSLSDQPTEEQ